MYIGMCNEVNWRFTDVTLHVTGVAVLLDLKYYWMNL